MINRLCSAFNFCFQFEPAPPLQRGGLFEYVTCPHYLGEWLEWTGFAVATQTRAGWAFAFWTLANLLPRAVASRAWYRDKFGPKYPAGMRAMIPFIW
mmetsp:Transcript_37783/g.93562  ORF Transcript_37783/g.93562 Transcript_37783/m.93562 type:complete len:97 (+) Transcript_37783:49-339(+)